MSESGPHNPIGKRLIYPLTAVTVLLVLCIPVSLIYTFNKNTRQQEQYAIESAAEFVRTLTAYRTFYSRTIVKRLRGLDGVEVTHDYLQKPHAIPLPATFAKDFGHFMNNAGQARVNLYSDKPFPWRKSGNQEERQLNTFEQQALTKLKANPSQPVWQFADEGGEKLLHYAIADVLGESCVGCHNSYPGTPKTDWQVGDVRGVLTVSIPSATNQLARIWNREFGLVAALLATTAGLLMFVFNTLLKSVRREQNAREALHRSVGQLEIGANKNKAVFDSVHDAIIVINDQGIILETNQSVFEVLGYRPEELIGENISVIVNDQQAPLHDGFLARFRQNRSSPLLGTIRQELAKHKDGSNIPVELTINATQAGNEHLITGVIRDISQRKQAEDALRDAHQQALESARAKSQFMANMSHEIRTPMNGIAGMTQLLTTTQLNTQQDSYVNVLQKSSQSLMRIINDILDFSKIESGRYKLDAEWFPLLETLEDNIDLMAEVAFAKNIELSLVTTSPIPQFVYGDRGRIGQILNNLIHNAIKFTAEGGVLVNICMDESADKNREDLEDGVAPIVIEVIDSGPGIAKSQIGQLFEPFTQADDTHTRQFGGTGLGLALCKEFAELMDGSIAATSSVGEGSTFRVTLPLKTRGTPYFPQSKPGSSIIMLLREAGTQFRQQLAAAYAHELELAGITHFHLTSTEDELRHLVKQQNGEAIVVVDIDAVLPQGLDDESMREHVCTLIARCRETTSSPLILYGKPKLVSELGMLIGSQFDNLVLVPKPVKPSIVLNALTQVGVFAAAELPATKPGKPTAAPQSPDSRLNKRILVVEDNNINYTVIEQMLKKLGYRFFQRAIHGEAALQALQNSPFDLILMDCQMPVMDGFTATEIIRKLEQTQSQQTGNHNGRCYIPIIALTANVLKVDQDRCFRAGMDDYLAKPVEMSKLQACLDKWLGNDTEKR